MTTDTVMRHKAMREIKERYELQKAELTLRLDTEQVTLSTAIDLARNELHYLSCSMRKPDADLDTLKHQLDAAAKVINELSLRKAALDYDRKQSIIALRRQRDEQLLALDQNQSQPRQEGGEV